MPSILQGGPKPMAPPPSPGPMMPPAAAGADDGKQLVASVYEKPDGTYCTEDATGQLTEFPDISSALDHVQEMSMGGMEGPDESMTDQSGEDTGESQSGKDY